MKIKEAMAILVEFKKIAGEDAELHLQEFRLCGYLQGSYNPYQCDEKKICYSVVAIPYEQDICSHTTKQI